MARFDRNALALDAGVGHGAIDAMRAFMVQVGDYTYQVRQINLEPVALFGTTIDVFSTLPGLRQSLVIAKSHAEGWAGVGMQLHIAVITGVYTFGEVLQRAAGEIGAVAAEAARQQRPLSPSERAGVLAKLHALEASLREQSGGIERLKPQVVDFTRLITGDHAALTSGSQRLEAAIPILDQKVNETAMKYMRPDSQGIMKMVLEQGAKIRSGWVALAASLGPLVGSNERAQQAIRELLFIWSTVEVKFKSVIDTLTETEGSVDSFAELPLLLDIAKASWGDLLDYFTHNT